MVQSYRPAWCSGSSSNTNLCSVGVVSAASKATAWNLHPSTTSAHWQQVRDDSQPKRCCVMANSGQPASSFYTSNNTAPYNWSDTDTASAAHPPSWQQQQRQPPAASSPLQRSTMSNGTPNSALQNTQCQPEQPSVSPQGVQAHILPPASQLLNGTPRATGSHPVPQIGNVSRSRHSKSGWDTPQSISAQIKQCQGLQDLQALITRYRSSLNFIHVTALCTRLAALAQVPTSRQGAARAVRKAGLNGSSVDWLLNGRIADVSSLDFDTGVSGNAAPKWRSSPGDGLSGSLNGDTSDPSVDGNDSYSNSGTGRASHLHPTFSGLTLLIVPLVDQHVATMDARGVANCVWALAKVASAEPSVLKDTPLLHTLQRLLLASEAKGLDTCNAQQLSNMLWAVATLSQLQPLHTLPPAGWVAAVLAALQSQLGSANGQCLSNSLWACAQLQHTPPQPWLLACFSRCSQVLQLPRDDVAASAGVTTVSSSKPTSSSSAAPRMSSPSNLEHSELLQPQALSNILWSLAHLRLPPPPPSLLQQMLLASQSQLSAFDMQGLSNTVWALASLRVQPPADWCQRFAVIVCRRVSNSSSYMPQHIVNILWAIATMRKMQVPSVLPLSGSSWSAAGAATGSGDGRQVQLRSAWDVQLPSVLLKAAEPCLPQLPPHAVAMLSWAVQSIPQLKVSAAWVEAWEVASIDRLSNFGVQELAACLLARVRWHESVAWSAPQQRLQQRGGILANTSASAVVNGTQISPEVQQQATGQQQTSVHPCSSAWLDQAIQHLDSLIHHPAADSDWQIRPVHGQLLQESSQHQVDGHLQKPAVQDLQPAGGSKLRQPPMLWSPDSMLDARPMPATPVQPAATAWSLEGSSISTQPQTSYASTISSDSDPARIASWLQPHVLVSLTCLLAAAYAATTARPQSTARLIPKLTACIASTLHQFRLDELATAGMMLARLDFQPDASWATSFLARVSALLPESASITDGSLNDSGSSSDGDNWADGSSWSTGSSSTSQLRSTGSLLGSSGSSYADGTALAKLLWAMTAWRIPLWATPLPAQLLSPAAALSYSRMDGKTLASLAWGLARSSASSSLSLQRSAAPLHRLYSALQATAHSLTSRDLSLTLWAAARLPHRPWAGWVEFMAAVVTNRAATASGNHKSSLGGMATVAQDGVAATVVGMPAQDLLLALWSLQSLGGSSGDGVLSAPLLQLASLQPGALSLAQRARVLHILSRAGGNASSCISSQSLQQPAVAAWLCQLFESPAFFKTPQQHQLPPSKDTVMLLSSLAALLHRPTAAPSKPAAVLLQRRQTILQNQLRRERRKGWWRRQLVKMLQHRGEQVRHRMHRLKLASAYTWGATRTSGGKPAADAIHSSIYVPGQLPHPPSAWLADCWLTVQQQLEHRVCHSEQVLLYMHAAVRLGPAPPVLLRLAMQQLIHGGCSSLRPGMYLLLLRTLASQQPLLQLHVPGAVDMLLDSFCRASQPHLAQLSTDQLLQLMRAWGKLQIAPEPSWARTAEKLLEQRRYIMTVPQMSQVLAAVRGVWLRPDAKWLAAYMSQVRGALPAMHGRQLSAITAQLAKTDAEVAAMWVDRVTVVYGPSD